MKNKTTSTGWVRGEAQTQRVTLPASPLAQPVEVVLFFALPVRAILGVPFKIKINRGGEYFKKKKRNEKCDEPKFGSLSATQLYCQLKIRKLKQEKKRTPGYLRARSKDCFLLARNKIRINRGKENSKKL